MIKYIMNTCKNCGTEIKSNNKYCSLNCRNIYVNKNLRNYKANGNSLSNKFKIEYEKHPNKCKECNNIIPYNLRENTFCSKNCRKISLIKWNNNRKGEKRNFSIEGINNIKLATNNKFNMVIDNYQKNPNYCKECGNELIYKKRNSKFCSIECKRKFDTKNLNEYQKYYKECQFKFNLGDYPNEFDFSLIEKYGWYKAKNHGNNLNGISRDHMISIKYGFKNKIDSNIISHPANCKLMIHNENVSKYTDCSITLNELLIKINDWNLKYTHVV